MEPDFPLRLSDGFQIAIYCFQTSILFLSQKKGEFRKKM